MLKQFKKFKLERTKKKKLNAIKNQLVNLDPVTEVEQREAMIQRLEKLL